MITGNEMQTIHRQLMHMIHLQIGMEAMQGGEICNAVEESLRLGVHKYVYSGYDGTVYTRRMEGGGLADVNNYYTVIRRQLPPYGIEMEIEDRTPAGDSGMINPPPDPVTYLSDVIEAGANGPKWHDPDWPGARPYMDLSMQDGCSRSGIIEQATISAINHAQFHNI